MKLAFFLPIVAVVAAWLYNGYLVLEIGKEMHYTKSNCKAVRGAQGTEDLVLWKGNVLVGNLATTQLWMWPGKDDPSQSDAASAKSGSIYHLRNVESDNPILEKTIMKGFPEGVAFHAHGLGLIGDLLFAINHAYSKGGERVDVFQLSQEESNGKITLTYVSSVVFSNDYSGLLNDIVPISKDEFYATVWLPWPDSTKGRSTSLLSKLANTLYLVNPFGVKSTWLVYCRGSSGTSEALCRKTGTKAAMWNGITSDGKVVYALDLIAQNVVAFQRNKDGDLVDPKSIPFPGHYGDNLYYSAEDGQIWTSGMAHMFDCYMKWVDELTRNVGVVPKGGPSPSGGLCPIHSSSLDPATGKVTHHVVHDGSLLGGASGSLKVGSKIVIGTFVDEGVLVCDA